MLSSIISSASFLAGWLTPRSIAVDCSKSPSWTFEKFVIESRDEVGQNGTAAFKFIDNLSSKTENLNCSLHSNYRCEFDGTPSDDSVVINIQAMMDRMYVSVSQTLKCDGDAGLKSQSVGGSGELDMNCTIAQFGPTSCTVESGTIRGVSVASD